MNCVPPCADKSRSEGCELAAPHTVTTFVARMQYISLLLGLLLLPVALHAADLRPVITREAGKCAAAWQRNDYEGVLGFLPPRVVQQNGGRKAALKKIKSTFNKAEEYGVESMDFTAGQPTPPLTISKWLTSLVPLTVVLHRTPLDVTQATHLLALSSDQGKHWSFVPLYHTSQAKLNLWFPEFAGKIIVPAETEPRFEVAF